MHARGSGEAARRAKRGQPLPSRAISHARGHLRVSRFARQTTEKRETARSLLKVPNIKRFVAAKLPLFQASTNFDAISDHLSVIFCAKASQKKAI